MKYNILLLLGLIVCANASAQIMDAKHINRSYKVNESTIVEITNKYGKVHIIHWDKDSVQFNIDVKVRGANPARVEKLMNSLDFDFTATQYYVIAQTVVKSANGGGFLNDLLNIAESIANADSYVEVNYLVMVPSYTEISIDNKYGDVYVSDMSAPFKLKLSNGNFKGNKLTGETDLTLKVVDANIREVSRGVINLSYGSIDIDNAGELRIESKSSKIDIEGAEELRINSRRDKFNVNEVNTIRGTTNFSDIWIYHLYESTDLTMTYGSLNSDNTSSGCSLIKVSAAYTDINLFFEPESTYLMDLKLRETAVTYPSEMQGVQENMINENEKRSIMTGTMGASPKMQVKLENERGVINLYKR